MSERGSERALEAWRPRDFLFVGVLAAVVFGVAFALGSGIMLATGIPATGGLGNIFAAVFLLVLGFQLVPRLFFGSLTLGIMFALAVPTLIGGPIGPLKIINGLIIGVTFDLIVILGRRSAASQIIGAGVASVVSLWAVYFGLVLLDLPGVERLEPLLGVLSLVQAILGVGAAALALRLFRTRIRHWPAVRRFVDAP